eukprot:Rhum_TRINITY_DN25043_c0_g2::Rhum_TRINITY_DN25043_c0_g2_i1::g.181064::m.181064
MHHRSRRKGSAAPVSLLVFFACVSVASAGSPMGMGSKPLVLGSYPLESDLKGKGLAEFYGPSATYNTALSPQRGCSYKGSLELKDAAEPFYAMGPLPGGPNTAFSMGLWLNPVESTTSMDRRVLLTLGSPAGLVSNKATGLWLGLFSSKVVVGFDSNSDTDVHHSQLALSPNVWTFLYLTYDGDKAITVYSGSGSVVMMVPVLGMNLPSSGYVILGDFSLGAPANMHDRKGTFLVNGAIYTTGVAAFDTLACVAKPLMPCSAAYACPHPLGALENATCNAGSDCDDAKCCQYTCYGHQCPATHTPKDTQTPCGPTASDCSDAVCCTAKTSCEAVACDGDYQDKEGKNTLTCASVCEIPDCCDAKQYCATWTPCPSGHVAKKDNATIACPRMPPTCDLETCCDPSCGSFTCPQGYTDKPAKNDILCNGASGQVCDEAVCCDPVMGSPQACSSSIQCPSGTAINPTAMCIPRQTCSIESCCQTTCEAYSCPAYTNLKPDNATIVCGNYSDTCDDADCCDNGCSPDTCSSMAGGLLQLKPDYSEVDCAAAQCTEDECCEPAPLRIACSQFTCPSNMLAKQGTAQTMCDHLNTQAQEGCRTLCCKPAVMCSSYQCPASWKAKTGKDVKCGALPSDCKAQLCCDEVQLCKSDQTCKQGFVLRSNYSDITCSGASDCEMACCEATMPNTPTDAPTKVPMTDAPTDVPTGMPTSAPTDMPATDAPPTAQPDAGTPSPTSVPATAAPTSEPTDEPAAITPAPTNALYRFDALVDEGADGNCDGGCGGVVGSLELGVASGTSSTARFEALDLTTVRSNISRVMAVDCGCEGIGSRVVGERRRREVDPTDDVSSGSGGSKVVDSILVGLDINLEQGCRSGVATLPKATRSGNKVYTLTVRQRFGYSDACAKKANFTRVVASLVARAPQKPAQFWVTYIEAKAYPPGVPNPLSVMLTFDVHVPEQPSIGSVQDVRVAFGNTLAQAPEAGDATLGGCAHLPGTTPQLLYSADLYVGASSGRGGGVPFYVKGAIMGSSRSGVGRRFASETPAELAKAIMFALGNFVDWTRSWIDVTGTGIEFQGKMYIKTSMFPSKAAAGWEANLPLQFDDVAPSLKTALLKAFQADGRLEAKVKGENIVLLELDRSESFMMATCYDKASRDALADTLAFDCPPMLEPPALSVTQRAAASKTLGLGTTYREWSPDAGVDASNIEAVLAAPTATGGGSDDGLSGPWAAGLITAAVTLPLAAAAMVAAAVGYRKYNERRFHASELNFMEDSTTESTESTSLEEAFLDATQRSRQEYDAMGGEAYQATMQYNRRRSSEPRFISETHRL